MTVPGLPALTVGFGPKAGTAPTSMVTHYSGDGFALDLTHMGGDSLTLNIPAAQLVGTIDGLTTDLWLYRDGVKWQRFRVLPVRQKWSPSGEDVLAVTGASYAKVIAGRHLHSDALVYDPATEQGTIVWQLINHSQSQPGGALGITQGTTATGISRVRTEYKNGDNIGHLLANLSGCINGPWWGIDGDLVLTVKLPSTFPTHVMPIHHGANSLELERVPGTYWNACGASGGRGTTLIWAEDPSIATDPRGRWEKIGAQVNASDASVTEHADGLLAEGLNPPAQWNVSMDPRRYFSDSFYTPGMFVNLAVPRSAADVVGVPVDQVLVLVTNVKVTASSAGEVKVGLSAVEVV